ncbi:flagellar hook-associated protein FlgK [Halocynthiibacter sp.]|uniref:flagellar hook-associated protein FlgK n=1 Tax=Halocynthiibacter sp. TaxID=1979210 RepID=UPI003C678F4B
MSITGSIANALSGLNATSRRAEIVSSNIANANTEGYGVRQLDVSAATVAGGGAGVRIDGVTRLIDNGVIQDRRLADASLGESTKRSSFFASVENAIGSPEEAGSLSGRIADLEAALISAASRPDSEPRLNDVLNEAQGITQHLKSASDQVQTLREEADHGIARDVKQLNEGLQNIRDINISIAATQARGLDAAALQDQRQRLIDGLSSIVPIRQVPRDNGTVALFTTAGTVLLDGKATEFGFQETSTITPDMTTTGLLSGLTVNGIPADTSSGHSLLRGGSLIANFEVRDELAIEAQSQLDAVARNLVERFQSPSTDPTLSPGDAGIFTDSGTAFSAADELGLSARLQINPLADPQNGGEIRRLRDGLGAIVPGNVGNASQLQRLASALQAPEVMASGSFSSGARGMTTLVSDLLSEFGTSRQAAEADVTYANVQFETFKNMELQAGVDTDREMQELLLVEQAYAANARVLQTADELIQMLIGL